MKVNTQPPSGTTPQIFWLYRKKDHSGVSGIGYVAVGTILPSGQTILEWIVGDHCSIEIHSNLDSLLAIHGHEGSTVVVDLLDLDEIDG